TTSRRDRAAASCSSFSSDEKFASSSSRSLRASSALGPPRSAATPSAFTFCASAATPSEKKFILAALAATVQQATRGGRRGSLARDAARHKLLQCVAAAAAAVPLGRAPRVPPPRRAAPG